MKAELLCFLTANERWFIEAQGLYVEKINHFQPFQIKKLNPLKQARSEKLKKIQHEQQVLLKELHPTDFVIALSEDGKQLSSKSWADLISRSEMSGKKRVVIVIGGAYGIHEDVKKRADVLVSLGQQTMNHLVAQVVFLEQWYRAWTIKRGLPYHNAD